MSDSLESLFYLESYFTLWPLLRADRARSNTAHEGARALTVWAGMVRAFSWLLRYWRLNN